MTERRRSGRYPAELRDRAVRVVFEAERHSGSQWEAIRSVAEKLGPTPETVRKCVRRLEIDEGHRPGLTRTSRVPVANLADRARRLSTPSTEDGRPVRTLGNPPKFSAAGPDMTAHMRGITATWVQSS